MTRVLILFPMLAGLAACDNSMDVNPPTEPADPIPSADVAGQAAPGALTLPGRGPASFVGRWAANVAWCASPRDVRRPIEVTPTRFEGYEHSCAIDEVAETPDGYVASLQCLSEGVSSHERVKMAVAADVMKLTWLDRDNLTTTLYQCTTLTDTPEGVVPPSVASSLG